MRRGLSLLALGCTLLGASAAPIADLELSSISLVNTAMEDKDSWKMVGGLYDVDNTIIEGFAEEGIEVSLEAQNDDLDEVVFTGAECKALANERGLICKTPGARLTLKKATTSQKPDSSTYYKGMYRTGNASTPASTHPTTHPSPPSSE